MRKLLLVAIAVSLLPLSIQAQDASQLGSSWQPSANGYIWVGTRYFGGIANTSFDERKVLQGGLNIAWQKRGTKVVVKTWWSLSPEKDGTGKQWTGNAQEFDLGAEVAQSLGQGWTVKAGYSHFFITKSAGSDVEMIVLAVSKDILRTEHGQLAGRFEFYQFLPTSSKGPASGRFYMPSVEYAHTRGKWTAAAGLAGAFNTSGVFGFKAEPAVKITGQLLYALPKGKTGPDFTYGGVPGSHERPMRFTVGWSWIF